MFIGDAYSLSIYQSCRRRWALDQWWRVLRWRPKSLLDSCLREGIFSLSSGKDPIETIQLVKARFLTQAANPGLDLLGTDPYVVAMDLCAVLATVLTALSRITLLPLTRIEPRVLSESEGLAWRPLSWADESGVLHRWITVDRWNDDELARQVHGWSVFGDMVVCDTPMTLHVIEIGQRRKGRQETPWCRAFKHPVIAGHLKFQRTDGKGGHRALQGEQWKPLWFTDLSKASPAEWVDRMDADGVTPQLQHHLLISQPSDDTAREGRRQLSQELAAMRGLYGKYKSPSGPMQVPMNRGACDANHQVCPWQMACYRERPEHAIDGLGLYQLRAAGEDERSSPPPSTPPDTTSDPLQDDVLAT